MRLRIPPRHSIALALAVTLLRAAPAAAHPHVFIDYSLAVVFNDRAVESVRMSWTFDEM